MAKETYLRAAVPKHPTDTIRPARSAAELTRPNFSPEARLYDAASLALENAAFDGGFRSTVSGVARAIARANPVFRGGGRGLRRAAVGVRDGVYVDRAAAVDRGLRSDLENLVRFDLATKAKPWTSMTREEKLILTAQTGGWQELPTGEVVKQIPKFEYVQDAWRPYERFTGRGRNLLSHLAQEEFPSDSVPFGKMIRGPGADELFAYYPELKTARMTTGGNAVFGSAGSRSFNVGEKSFRGGVRDVTNTIHHEPQHLVQAESAHGPGSGPVMAEGGLRKAAEMGYEEVPEAVSKTYGGRAAAAARGNADRMRLARQASELTDDPAMARYAHSSGEAGAYAVGRTATEGPEPLVTDAMRKEGIEPGMVYDMNSPEVVAQKSNLRDMDARAADLALATGGEGR